ncbi:MAG: hypothetical protein ACHP9Z_32245 [Streptosporangiales bacterium]
MMDADRRIEPAARVRYESRAGAHHHHNVCRQCAAVTEVDCEVGHGPCLEPAAGAWSLAGEAEVTFWGLCAGCRARDQDRRFPPRTPPVIQPQGQPPDD